MANREPLRWQVDGITVVMSLPSDDEIREAFRRNMARREKEERRRARWRRFWRIITLRRVDHG